MAKAAYCTVSCMNNLVERLLIRQLLTLDTLHHFHLILASLFVSVSLSWDHFASLYLPLGITLRLCISLLTSLCFAVSLFWHHFASMCTSLLASLCVSVSLSWHHFASQCTTNLSLLITLRLCVSLFWHHLVYFSSRASLGITLFPCVSLFWHHWASFCSRAFLCITLRLRTNASPAITLCLLCSHASLGFT